MVFKKQRLNNMSVVTKIIYFTATLYFILTLSGCMYISGVHFDDISVDSSGHTNYQHITATDKGKIRDLSQDIINLNPSFVDHSEAYLVAYEAILYPKILANRYQLMTPPNFHNQLVNAGRRKKGHCYHFAQDMMIHLNRPYKTLTLERAMAYQGEFLEHNVPTIRAKGQNIRDAIILDAWRESANLVWMVAKDDRAFPWIRYTPRKVK